MRPGDLVLVIRTDSSFIERYHPEDIGLVISNSGVWHEVYLPKVGHVIQMPYTDIREFKNDWRYRDILLR